MYSKIVNKLKLHPSDSENFVYKHGVVMANIMSKLKFSQVEHLIASTQN